jgi:histidinol-phosphate phosphatase family protein
MKVLGINAIFHDPAAALVVDGQIIAAAEEERFSRRKHGRWPVPFSAWELPEQAARWCLDQAGLAPWELDAVGYSFDPEHTRPASEMGLHDPWDHLRRTYAQSAPGFIATALPGLGPGKVRFVAHHGAHAASAGLAAPFESCDVLVLDGRGECASHLAGCYDDAGTLKTLATQQLPHSVGLLYEDLTEHLGFLRSSDEYKVMALAAHGTPRYIDVFGSAVYTTGDGGFRTELVDWAVYAPARRPGQDWTQAQADLAASVQCRLEEVLVDLARWLRAHTGGTHLTMAGGVALNCVANTVIAERTAGLETALWITADMTYRRSALAATGGFDERFPRAYREDVNLALRVMTQGGRLDRGRRGVIHPVRPAGTWDSVRAQAGNADDMLMRHLHGPDWHRPAGAPRGRRSQHLATTLTGTALALVASGRPWAAALPAAYWLAATANFAAARIAPGPREQAEIVRMQLTSAVIPAAATWHTLRGLVRHRHAGPWRGPPDLVLLDRDGTLVRDVPYNADPALVDPMPGVKEALDRLRSAGTRLGVVTNQSGVARGLLTRTDVERVNDRVEQDLGPFDVWQVCPHGPDDGCGCRKPSPGMVTAACAELGVDVHRCVVVGDIGPDVAAAEAAGATGILVPGPQTRPAEVTGSCIVAPDLLHAADVVLGGEW